MGEAHVSRTSKHLENAPWLQPAICHLFQKLLGLCELQCDFKGFLSHWLMPVKPLLLWLSYYRGDFTNNTAKVGLPYTGYAILTTGTVFTTVIFFP